MTDDTTEPKGIDVWKYDPASHPAYKKSLTLVPTTVLPNKKPHPIMKGADWDNGGVLMRGTKVGTPSWSLPIQENASYRKPLPIGGGVTATGESTNRDGNPVNRPHTDTSDLENTSPDSFLEGAAIICLHVLVGRAIPIFPTSSRKGPSEKVVISLDPLRGGYTYYGGSTFDWAVWEYAIVPVLDFYGDNQIIKESVKLRNFDRPIRMLEGMIRDKYVELGWLPA